MTITFCPNAVAWGDIATWFGAIGTMTAVLVSALLTFWSINRAHKNSVEHLDLVLQAQRLGEQIKNAETTLGIIKTCKELCRQIAEQSSEIKIQVQKKTVIVEETIKNLERELNFYLQVLSNSSIKDIANTKIAIPAQLTVIFYAQQLIEYIRNASSDDEREKILELMFNEFSDLQKKISTTEVEEELKDLNKQYAAALKLKVNEQTY